MTARDADYAATVRAAVDHLAGHDPARRRFGAARHGYRLAAPIEPARLAAIEAALDVRLPDSYRAHLLGVGDGGAGPYHGLLPLDHDRQRAAARGTFALDAPTDDADAPAGTALYAGVVPLAHLGCGQVAFLVVRGAARGQVWLDARAAGAGVRPIHPDFHPFYAAWIDALAHARWQEAHVAPGRCPLPHVLTQYLHGVEDERGIDRDRLPPEAVREALAAIPDGGIAITDGGGGPLFDAGEPVDLCTTCERMVENLSASGMRRAQIRPGVAPLPLR